jgi:bifunctional non-homologous end joining protein LigD
MVKGGDPATVFQGRLPSTGFRRYIGGMLWRNSRGRPNNAPAAFTHRCQPTVAKQPPTGPGWAHELKHDGYRLQIHVRDGRVRLYTMNGADWSKRYPRVLEEAARIKTNAIMDAEVVCLDYKGVANFDMLHSRNADHLAVACAFDLLMVDGDDLRPQPFRERKLSLGKLLLRSSDGIQYVEHAEGHGDRMFEAVCKLGLEGIVSKKLEAIISSKDAVSRLVVELYNVDSIEIVLHGGVFSPRNMEDLMPITNHQVPSGECCLEQTLQPLSFPKIISGRSDDAVRPRLEWRQ